MSAATKRRRLGAKLLLLAFAMLFAFGSCELFLRLVDPGGYAEFEDREQFTTALLTRGSDGVLRMRPGTTSTFLGKQVVVSEQGLRNRVVVTPKPAGTFRILVVGDSVPFGWGVAEGEEFPRLLENELHKTPRADGKRYEVINGGSPGWGLVDEYYWLRDHGIAFAPDLVLHSIINNDIEAHPKAPPLFLTDGLRRVRTLRLVEKVVGMIAGDPGDEPNTALTPDLVVRAIDEFVALCTQHGAKYAVIDAFERVQEPGKPERRFPLEAVAHMKDVGVPLLDLALTREWVHAHQVAKNDYHPGASGHAEIAAKLLPMVRDLAEK